VSGAKSVLSSLLAAQECCLHAKLQCSLRHFWNANKSDRYICNSTLHTFLLVPQFASDDTFFYFLAFPNRPPLVSIAVRPNPKLFNALCARQTLALGSKLQPGESLLFHAANCRFRVLMSAAVADISSGACESVPLWPHPLR
jgi:hypothetical protein